MAAPWPAMEFTVDCSLLFFHTFLLSPAMFPLDFLFSGRCQALPIYCIHLSGNLLNGNGVCPWKHCCHISKQRMLLPSSHHITAAMMVSPEGTQDTNRIPTPKGAPWGDPGWESPRYWPQIAEVHIKGMVSINPDSFVFQYIEKC